MSKPILAAALISLALGVSGCGNPGYRNLEDCEATVDVCHMNIWGKYSPGPGIDPNSAAGAALIEGVLSQPLYIPSPQPQPSHFSCDNRGTLTFCDAY